MRHPITLLVMFGMPSIVTLPIGAGQSPRAQLKDALVEERTATTHPIHYLVSLPQGWTREKRWPVVIVITDAYREFHETAREFASARGSRPFIIVVPLVLSGGGPAKQHRTDFDYAPAVWTFADSVGSCRFDDQGMTAVLRDVHREYNGDNRIFITGWEAGGHVVLAQLFGHPERIRALAVSTPNFQGRCVSANGRVARSLANIPVRGFHGVDDVTWVRGQPLYDQWPQLESVAHARGFTNVADTLIPHQGRGPMPDAVLSFFNGFLGR
ncbi:MAG TPA: hypothetical protein VGG76_06815 [Gemmatimonadaceae bacterium]|jgi:dienelactone hydrolase